MNNTQLIKRFDEMVTTCKNIFTDRGKSYGVHKIFDSKFNPIHLGVMVETKCNRIVTMLWDEENFKMREDINEEVLKDSLLDLVNYAFFLYLLVQDDDLKAGAISGD